MSLSKALVTSNSQTWTTPNEFWNPLHKHYKFDLDVAACKTNTKCERFYSEEDNALTKPWAKMNWCNPPYGDKKYPVKAWIKKGYEEGLKGNTTVFLLPINKQDQAWFHDYAIPFAEILIVKGRIHFVDAITGKRPTRINKQGKVVVDGNSQGSMLIVFGPNLKDVGKIKSCDWRKTK